MGWYAIGKESSDCGFAIMILQYEHFLSVFDDPPWVSIFIPIATIYPNPRSYGVASFYFYFLKVYNRFDLMSCDDVMAGIVKDSHSVSKLTSAAGIHSLYKGTRESFPYSRLSI